MTIEFFTLASAEFQAARQVGILPEGHPSSRLHGHGFAARVRQTIKDPQVFDHLSQKLRGQLQAIAEKLDHQYLNDIISVPTDENIARWIYKQLASKEVTVCGVQSTASRGVDLTSGGRAHIWHRFRFEAAHRLPNVPEGHQCGRLHGHGFEVLLHADQNIANQDMGVDFDRLQDVWQPLHEQLHCCYLNDIPGLENPTSEMIAAWLWERLKHQLPEISWVTVYETSTAGCHYDGTHFRIWKERTFESAVRLNVGPESDIRRRIHGHSYLLRLHLTAPLDQVMGWTVDYGDVKELFASTYKRLDHHYLNEIPGLESGSSSAIADWVRSEVGHRIPGLDRIDLFETPGNGICLSWGELGPALPLG